jgi:hypothetical protein
MFFLYCLFCFERLSCHLNYCVIKVYLFVTLPSSSPVNLTQLFQPVFHTFILICLEICLMFQFCNFGATNCFVMRYFFMMCDHLSFKIFLPFSASFFSSVMHVPNNSSSSLQTIKPYSDNLVHLF